jgi:hypothetical protein
MRHRSFLRGSTRRLSMRFDGERPKINIKEVDPSLKPRVLDLTHTPFPLPRYDEAFGFGPTRMQHIPDVARAKATMRDHVRLAEATFAETEESAAAVNALQRVPVPPSDVYGAAYVPEYEQQPGYPVVERLVCNRSVADLLTQFLEHPTAEGKSAAISDLTSTLDARSPEELANILSTLGGTIEADGKGFNFLARRIQGRMTIFWAPGALLGAFTSFVSEVETLLLSNDGFGLRSRCPPFVLVELLHFLAKAKILEPDLWYTRHETQRSSMATSLSARGHNKHHYNKGYGLALLDGIKDLLSNSDATASYVDQCSSEELVEILAGLSGIDPTGCVEGPVVNELLHGILYKLPDEETRLGHAKVAEIVGRLALVTEMAHISNTEVHTLVDRYPPTGQSLMALAKRRPAEPDLLERRLRDFHASAPTSDFLEAWHGICELLQAFPDKQRAAALIDELGLDSLVLQNIPHFQSVSDMLQSSKKAALSHSTMSSQPLFTYCAGLPRIRGLAAACVLHSSIIGVDLTPLIHVCQRLRGGRVGLLVTTHTLLNIARLATASSRPSVRGRFARSLQLLAYEIRRKRVCLVTLADEIKHVGDSGSYADEDVMTWNLMASLNKDAPMTLPKMLVLKGHTASAPFRHLKSDFGESFRTASNAASISYSASLIGDQKELSRRSNALTTREIVKGSVIKTPIKIRDPPSRVHGYSPKRASLAYRRDRPLYDKFRPRGRYIAPGFGPGGALDSDLRGLGIHTPDHPQPAGMLSCVAKPPPRTKSLD